VAAHHGGHPGWPEFACLTRINRQKVGCWLMQESVDGQGSTGGGGRPWRWQRRVGSGFLGERNGRFSSNRALRRGKHCDRRPRSWRARHSIWFRGCWERHSRSQAGSGLCNWIVRAPGLVLDRHHGGPASMRAAAQQIEPVIRDLVETPPGMVLAVLPAGRRLGG